MKAPAITCITEVSQTITQDITHHVVIDDHDTQLFIITGFALALLFILIGVIAICKGHKMPSETVVPMKIKFGDKK